MQSCTAVTPVRPGREMCAKHLGQRKGARTSFGERGLDKFQADFSSFWSFPLSCLTSQPFQGLIPRCELPRCCRPDSTPSPGTPCHPSRGRWVPAQQPNSRAHHLFLQMKFHQNTALPTHPRLACGCFLAAPTELSSCNDSIGPLKPNTQSFPEKVCQPLN